MESFTANSKTDLFRHLKEMDTTVPLEGRTTQHRERWSICRLLSTLAKNDYFIYPLEVLHRDRPDFVLRKSSNHSIGIEITEVIPTELAHAEAVQERDYPDSILDLSSSFRWSDPPKTRQDLIKLLSADKISVDSGWAGDTLERECAKATKDTILKKTDTLNKAGFEQFHENWLLLYENMGMWMMGNKNQLRKFLMPLLQGYWEGPQTIFNAVFIVISSNIIEIRPKLWNVYNS